MPTIAAIWNFETSLLRSGVSVNSWRKLVPVPMLDRFKDSWWPTWVAHWGAELRPIQEMEQRLEAGLAALRHRLDPDEYCSWALRRRSARRRVSQPLLFCDTVRPNGPHQWSNFAAAGTREPLK